MYIKSAKRTVGVVQGGCLKGSQRRQHAPSLTTVEHVPRSNTANHMVLMITLPRKGIVPMPSPGWMMIACTVCNMHVTMYAVMRVCSKAGHPRLWLGVIVCTHIFVTQTSIQHVPKVVMHAQKRPELYVEHAKETGYYNAETPDVPRIPVCKRWMNPTTIVAGAIATC